MGRAYSPARRLARADGGRRVGGVEVRAKFPYVRAMCMRTLFTETRAGQGLLARRSAQRFSRACV